MARPATSTLKLVLGAVREVRGLEGERRPIVLCGRPVPVQRLHARLLEAPHSDERAAELFALRRLQPGDEASLARAAVVVYGGEVAAALDAETRGDLEVVGRAARPLLSLLEALDLPSEAVSQAGLVPGVSPNDILPYRRGEDSVERALRALARRAADSAPSLASRLPAFRPYVVDDLIENAARRNAALAVAWFLPGADLPALSAVQLRLVLRIGACYGEDISPDRGIELLSALGAGLGFRAVARELLDLVPVVGWAVQGGVAYTGTRALGRAAVAYFEHGAVADVSRVRSLVETLRGELAGSRVGGR